MGQLALGHGAFALCAILYLAWWWIFFRPETIGPSAVTRVFGIVCIVGAAICGIASVVIICLSLGGLPRLRSTIGNLWIVIGGALVYAALLLLTSNVFHRPVTTELILIVGWATMEAAVLATLYGSMRISGAALAVLAIIVAVVFVGSLVCYMLYYNLEPWPSFIDGLIPLASAGVVSVIMVLLLTR